VFRVSLRSVVLGVTAVGCLAIGVPDCIFFMLGAVRRQRAKNFFRVYLGTMSIIGRVEAVAYSREVFFRFDKPAGRA